MPSPLRYHISFRRADGEHPGQDVPYGYDGAVTATVSESGSTTISFELIRHVTKKNRRSYSWRQSSIIHTIAGITFYGTVWSAMRLLRPATCRLSSAIHGYVSP